MSFRKPSPTTFQLFSTIPLALVNFIMRTYYTHGAICVHYVVYTMLFTLCCLHCADVAHVAPKSYLLHSLPKLLAITPEVVRLLSASTASNCTCLDTERPAFSPISVLFCCTFRSIVLFLGFGLLCLQQQRQQQQWLHVD